MKLHMFAKLKIRLVKFDHHLATFLYKTKTLKLEGIGTFTLDGKVSVPNELDKEIYYPIDGLAFTYNPKNETDDDLIQFLVKRLGKIQPLVRSDLESYLSNIKQFINLGKPYTIEGIGTLSKNNLGVYEFTPGTFLPVKEELNPRRENEEHNYPVRTQSSAARVFVVILIVIAALAALGGIGWGVSTLITKYQKNNSNTESQVPVDTITEEKADTVPVVTTPPVVQTPAVTDDSVSYKWSFEITKHKERARMRSEQLQQFGTPVKVDTIFIRDSLRYRLYLPLKILPADSTRIKDSLSLLFGSKVRMLKMPQ